MILISVQREEEVALAAAFIAALSASHDSLVLFADGTLANRFGSVFSRWSIDAALCALNPQNFELLVVFSGERRPENLDNLNLIELFNEIGIATLEIQHRYLQLDGSSGISVGYASKHFLRWEGEDGVGYLKSSMQPTSLNASARSGFVLVTSSDLLSDQDRHQFAIAVLKLAATWPQLHFLWKAHPGELRTASAEHAIALAEDYRLANLSVEREGRSEDFVPRCSCAISCPSTTLLDLQRHAKPVLVYQGTHSPALPERVEARTFGNAFELGTNFAELQRSPRQFELNIQVRELDTQRLVDTVRHASQSSLLRADWPSRALRYAQLVRSSRVDEQPQILEVERVSRELSRLTERITVLQRSTLAYKAKKLATRLRKPNS